MTQVFPAPAKTASAATAMRAGADALSPFVRHLAAEVRGDVMFDAASRGRYSTDASIYQIMPLGVVVPKDQDDLRRALDIARDHGAPVLARGAGSSQCGQTIGEALILDTTKWLNKIIDFDAGRRTVTVEPGIVLDHLNAFLKPHGLWYPVDVSTSAQATIGGMAGNNSCGSRSLRYGNMVHNVEAIDAVMPDGRQLWFGPLSQMEASAQTRHLVGEIQSIARRADAELVARTPKVLRRVAGYNLDLFNCQNPKPYSPGGEPNLSHLLVGSEGTLAVTRQITLRLSPLPTQRVLGVVNFPTFYQAMELTQHIVKLDPMAVELVDRTMIDLALTNPAFRKVVETALVGAPEALLLVEFSGEDLETETRNLRRLVALMGDLGLPGVVVELMDPAQQKALWDVRKAGLNIMMSMKGDGKPVSFIEDCAVPLEHLAEYTQTLTETFRKYGTEGTWYAHAGVGLLHVRPILDMRRDGAKKMRALAEEAAAWVRHFKGSYSGEHGDGLCRGEWVAWQYGPKINRAFQQIKALFDPENRFSPDRIVNPPKMDDAGLFRFAPGYRELPLSPKLDWSAWNVTRDPQTGVETAPGTGGDLSGGLAKAVEMCNNNGHCRKFDAGTMCPSYRVTKDERHVTRGRANTLRLALSGQIGRGGLASAEVKEVLDLCVSCKGCKRDCPTGVDMAKVKIEARAAWVAENGLRLRERMVAYMPHYAPFAGRVSWLLALGERLPVLAPWLKRRLGLAPARAFPRFRRSFLGRRPSATNGAANGVVEKDVFLFVDTFNNHMEPENAAAARDVLEAAGYRVHLHAGGGGRPLCCGRTLLAAGLVDAAKAEARRLLDAVLPFVERGVSIVGLEPSCLLSLRDEFLSYGYGEEARRLAKAAFLFEEFLVREHAAGRFAPRFHPLGASQALLHGHCHQKAFDAVRPIHTVLSWIPGLKVTEVEGSCCGMAGSFGYEAEHYEASLAMAELTLLPAVRKAPPGALVIADGTSCRHQIFDGARVDALHVARVLASALQPAGS
ncbi:MAG TPA: FAD-linked oxidase C-terminal domain-containing protein [Xanthobacteraceae bacterium]|jgi:FAD/FMN-containing dehydrogenase/Fe-S oxidoreductase|nr:MAG: FAD-binding oxidoreductase [Rhizobiales bacterium 39-66-18]HQS07676.1 FAD-linked oxidase C-terminal domain-containing protein [Xanthobacteraceae bacterium]